MSCETFEPLLVDYATGTLPDLPRARLLEHPRRRLHRYAELGHYWENLHPFCRWGGRFNDGGHFSITDRGRQ